MKVLNIKNGHSRLGCYKYIKHLLVMALCCQVA
jgi:hypothetical protein